jgi:hypothetical protein
MVPLTGNQLQRFNAVAAQPPSTRIRTGVRVGLVIGFVLAAIGLVVPVLSGTPGRLVVRDGSTASVAALVLGYLAAGPLSGATFGALFPLMRRDVGAVLVGVLAAAPVCFALTAAFVGNPGAWSRDICAVALIMTGAFGAGGFVVREQAISSPEELANHGYHDPAA